MVDRADLAAALAWHPQGARHLEHGSTTVDAAGRSAREHGSPDRTRGRWDYGAPSLQVWCGCGWAGPVHRQLQADGPDTEWRQANCRALAAMEGEWEDHVHEVLPTLGIYQARVRLEAAEKALTEAVGDSRRRGASWAEVGSATELGKKVAHSRWGGTKDVLLPRELSKGGRPRKPRPAPAETEAPPGPEPTSSAASSTSARADTGADGGGNPEDGAAAGAGGRGRPARQRERGWQVGLLADALSRRHGLTVAARWQGGRREDGGGWWMQWCGGPTRADMRADAALVVTEDPRLAGLEADELIWPSPTLSDVDEAALTLEWLQTHPEQGDRVSHLGPDDLAGWPENLSQQVRARAETLVAAGWGRYAGGAAADELAARAAAGGHEAVAVWLDELAASAHPYLQVVPDSEQ